MTEENTSLSSPIKLNQTPSDVQTYQTTHLTQQSTPTVVEEAVIWGTDISTKTVLADFTTFLNSFSLASEPLYKGLLEAVLLKNECELPLNLEHLHEFDKKLYFQVLEHPSEVLKVFDKALETLAQQVKNEHPAWPIADRQQVVCRPFNCKHWLDRADTHAGQLSMRDLGPANVDSLVSLKGLVIRAGQLLPDLQRAFYCCEQCGATLELDVERNAVTEPAACANEFCGERGMLRLLHVRSHFGNKQLVKLQELPEKVPAGETPLYVDAVCFDGLVDRVRPGDRVQVTGVYRIAGVRKSERRREVSSLYRAYLDVSHFALEEEAEIATKRNNAEITTLVQQLAARTDIQALLLRSLAPSVYGLPDVKKGILCLLFGGSQTTAFRSEINVLLCGDPGTSKSQLLRYVHKLAPRGVYTSGKSTSAVGLTAYVSKDGVSGDFVLESGALVLSDKGVCCVDEFDKMSEHARSIMHEAMEQQTVSLAKAGIVCSLNARTSVLAAANPKESRYNSSWSVVKNIRLPPSLLSRFDLIFLLLDKANTEHDRRLAEHVVSLYGTQTDSSTTDDIIESWLFRAYISHARKHSNPTIAAAAKDRLVDAYVELRALGASHNSNVISATPRQLESLVRIAEALAKIRLANEVLVSDVEEALALVKTAMRTAATDPKTGLVDIDLIATGVSAAERTALAEKGERLRVLLEEFRVNGKLFVSMKELLQLLKESRSENEQPLSQEELAELLKRLENEGIVRLVSAGRNAVKVEIVN